MLQKQQHQQQSVHVAYAAWCVQHAGPSSLTGTTPARMCAAHRIDDIEKNISEVMEMCEEEEGAAGKAEGKQDS
jgi:hypothetical protein